MTTISAMPTPPVMPLQPAVPPPQTAQGTLQDSGLAIVSDFQMKPDSLLPVNTRLELTRIFTLTEPRLVYPSDAFNNTGSCTARQYNLLSSYFHDVEFDLVFLAIKCPDTTGKILFEEQPDLRTLTASDNNAIQYPDSDGSYQASKYIWDVGESNVFTIKHIPPSYLVHRPTRDRNDTNPDAWFTSAFVMSWLTPYMHGSIYPDSFEIALFTRWYLKTYLPCIPHMISWSDCTWKQLDAPKGVNPRRRYGVIDNLKQLKL